MKKRIAGIVLGMILGFALCGCSGLEEVNKESVKSSETVSELKETLYDCESSEVPSESNEIAGTSETDKVWQDAYRTILCDLENYLSDPYELRWGLNENVYLGIHDFDNDNIPELIIGDSVSVAVFTYRNGEAAKIADLYEPDYWGGINQLFYRNNTLVLVSNGSDGNGYVCFTYEKGDYIKGFYDDYNQEIGIINESQVSKEDFEQVFILDELLQNSSVTYSQINMDNKTVIVNDNVVEIDKLDLTVIQW